MKKIAKTYIAKVKAQKTNKKDIFISKLSHPEAFHDSQKFEPFKQECKNKDRELIVNIN